MRFKVPQFIEVEDKLFGPLTAKQAVYCAGGVGFLVLLYALFPLYVAVVFGAPVAGLGVALAFYKRDGMPFAKILEHGFYYFYRNKLYIWQHRDKPTGKSRSKAAEIDADMYVPKLTESKLKDLAWSLDIKEHLH